MTETNHPLSNPVNWNKPKSWIVPLVVTVMVDDPKEYDEQMQLMLKKVLNELKAICSNLDRSGLQVSFLEEITDVKKFKEVLAGVKADDDAKKYGDELENKILDMKKRGLI